MPSGEVVLKKPLRVTRHSEQIIADDHRVILRPFQVGGPERVRNIVQRVLTLSEAQCAQLYADVLRDFGQRHRSIESVFTENFEEIAAPCVPSDVELTHTQQSLLGAYLTMEYSVEAAALFNPSLVPHPDQKRLPAGALRVIMSLRATGEGHVSSVAFRTGVVGPNEKVTFHRVAHHVSTARKVRDGLYHKYTFYLKLIEMGAYNDIAGVILERLPDEFVYEALLHAIDESFHPRFDPQRFEEAASHMRWLARSNYQLKFPDGADVADVVIFPVSENESRGIEDARFVRLVEDNGKVTYYGTYTAYNGFRILPQLLATTDFHQFSISTLNGEFAQNKGAALFPRRVDDWYMMVSRFDGENLFLLWSDNIRFWNEGKPLQSPRFPWEFVQIGNCGSPLETERGWLLLTHGVGPMRRYCIGASLLDLDDPSRVIAQTAEPLLMANEEERDGYVPNVVYSCGGLIHDGLLVLPYGMSDSATGVATVDVDELLTSMKSV